MSKPLLVAVSQRVDIYNDRGERRDALDQNLTRWLCRVGGILVPVPNALEHEGEATLQQWLMSINPGAVVLSGGNDIGKVAERDQTERQLLDYCFERTLPVLGICRGMQMMATWAGAELKQVSGHVRTRHHLGGKITAEVNSYHGFSLSTCPMGFEVLARSQDSEIEAIRHLSLPWEGWMWHPEREPVFLMEHLERVRRLFNA